jgi:hypothetical protein
MLPLKPKLVLHVAVSEDLVETSVLDPNQTYVTLTYVMLIWFISSVQPYEAK